MVQKTLENGMLARENVSNVMQTIKKLPIVLVIIVLIWIAIMTKEKMHLAPGLAMVNVNLPAEHQLSVTKRISEILAGQGKPVILLANVLPLSVTLAGPITMMANVTQLISVSIVINQILVPGQTFPRERSALPQE